MTKSPSLTRLARISLLLFASMTLLPLCAVTPDEAFERLKSGNEFFSTHNEAVVTTNLLRKEFALRQEPFASVLACSDSRVALELVFGQGLGDLFVVRVAGNVASEIAIESLEYGVAVLHTPLLVIMGHEHCGAVQAALDPSVEKSGQYAALLSLLRPAAEEAKKSAPNSSEEELLQRAVNDNIYNAYKTILAKSETIRQRVQEGTLKIALGKLSLPGGKVTWLPLTQIATLTSSRG